jgi:hypothetical protein
MVKIVTEMYTQVRISLSDFLLQSKMQQQWRHDYSYTNT